jgi:hypothetical protein
MVKMRVARYGKCDAPLHWQSVGCHTACPWDHDTAQQKATPLKLQHLQEGEGRGDEFATSAATHLQAPDIQAHSGQDLARVQADHLHARGGWGGMQGGLQLLAVGMRVLGGSNAPKPQAAFSLLDITRPIIFHGMRPLYWHVAPG